MYYVVKAGAIIKGGDLNSYHYECTVIDYNNNEYGEKSQFPYVFKSDDKSSNWCIYKPTHPGIYGFCWRIYNDKGEKVYEAGASRYFTGDFPRITGVYIPEIKNQEIRAGAIIEGSGVSGYDYYYECTVIDYDYAKYGGKKYPHYQKSRQSANHWCSYKPTHPGRYGFCWRIYNRNGVVISEYGATRYYK